MKMVKKIVKNNKYLLKTYTILVNAKKNFLIKYFPKSANKYLYEKLFHKKINLKNPRTFNEKIMWLNLNTYYQNKKVTQCADKYLVRQYIEKKGYKDILVDLIGVYDNANSIKWEELPEKFVLKCNHGAGFNIICTDKNKENEQEVKKQLQSWLKIDYSKKAAEFQYKDIDRKIICEKYINMGTDSKLPIDYKINCFNGKANCILVCSEREKGLKLDYYDLEWKYLDYIVDRYKSNREQAKPENLKEMIEIAENLSKGFPYVRVDLYNINGKIYFGELTFTPAAGLIAYMNDEGQEKLGNLIKI